MSTQPTKKAIKRRRKRSVKLVGVMGERAIAYRFAEMLLERELVTDPQVAAALASMLLEELQPIIEAKLLADMKEEADRADD